jgi:large subunit ribosomal protein L25
MEEILIRAQQRQGTGKSIVKKLRKDGWLPAVVYGRDTQPMPVTVSAKEWEKLTKHVRRNVILTLEIDEAGSMSKRPVMVKEVQRSVIGEKILHVDFLQVSMERMIEVEIPVELIGEARGIANNGMVEQHLRSIMVECLPTKIPEKIQIDVSELDIGDSYHVNQISIPGVKLLEHPDVAIVTVTPPEAEEVKAVVTEEAEKKEE